MQWTSLWHGPPSCLNTTQGRINVYNTTIPLRLTLVSRETTYQMRGLASILLGNRGMTNVGNRGMTVLGNRRMTRACTPDDRLIRRGNLNKAGACTMSAQLCTPLIREMPTACTMTVLASIPTNRGILTIRMIARTGIHDVNREKATSCKAVLHCSWRGNQ